MSERNKCQKTYPSVKRVFLTFKENSFGLCGLKNSVDEALSMVGDGLGQSAGHAISDASAVDGIFAGELERIGHALEAGEGARCHLHDAAHFEPGPERVFRL